MTTATPTEPVPEPAPRGPRRLTRSSSDKVIAGVAGGVGRYLGVDPVVCRIIFVVLIFFGGAGFIAYGAAWLLVPSDKSTGEDSARVRGRRVVVGLGVIVLTVVAFFVGAWWAALGSATVVAVVVIVSGVALAAGGALGGLRWLIAPALALALGAGLIAAANVDARGGVGERIYRPLTTSDLRPSYRLGVGHLVLDLRGTQLSPGDHHVKLNLGMGGAEVLVRPNVCVSTKSHMGVGGWVVFDRDSGGVDVDYQDARRARLGAPRLIVDANIGIGALRIEPVQHGRLAGNHACANA